MTDYFGIPPNFVPESSASVASPFSCPTMFVDCKYG